MLRYKRLVVMCLIVYNLWKSQKEIYKIFFLNSTYYQAGKILKLFFRYFDYNRKNNLATVTLVNVPFHQRATKDEVSTKLKLITKYYINTLFINMF